MKEYELFNEKASEFLGSYLSNEILEKGDIIFFNGENFIVSNLMIPENRKLRVTV